MANIKKSFNFRNGVQVDDDNFVINPNGLVGIGSTVPREFLDVRGNVIIDGLLTVNELFSDSVIIDTVNLSYANIGITSITSGIISASSGIVTYYGDGGNLINIPTSQWVDVDPGFGYTSIYSAGNVGVGTTFPFFTFQVGGNPIVSNGIGISSDGNIYSSGIITATRFVGNVTGNVNSSGVSTFSGGIQGDVTGNINSSGVSTFSGGIQGDVTGNVTGNINSSGVSTFSTLNVGTGVTISGGIVTATSFVGSLTGTASTTTNIPNLTGAITSNNSATSLGSFTSSQLAAALTDETGSGANVFATSPTLVNPALGNATATSIVVSAGIITASEFNGTLTGNVVGIASTARDLTSDARVSIEHIGSQTSSIGISTVSTRLYAESIGVGTNSPSSDIHIRRSSASTLQVTSDTAEAIIAIGRSTELDGSNGALIFGNTAGIYQYSDSKTLDIVNYDTGNINQYLDYGLAGVGTGNFNWIYGQDANNPLMSLTYEGNLGLGVTDPTVKFQVSGIASVSSLVTGDITATGNVVTTGAGTSTSVQSLYVYGGKSQILNPDGTSIFPPVGVTDNVNATSGISTFFDINVTNNAIIDGNIGIGTTNPEYPIQIGDYGGDIENSVVISQYGIGLGTDISNSEFFLDALGKDAVFGAIAIGSTEDKVKVGGGVTDGFRVFYVKGLSEFDGNVGIGTTNPTEELTVFGDARVTGILTVGTASITLDGTANIINVGSGVTIDGSTGVIEASSIVIEGTTFTGAAVTSITAGSGISVDQSTGNVTITATGGGLSGIATDSEKLNGEDPSYYLDYDNFTNTPVNLSDFNNDVGFITTFTDTNYWTETSVGIHTLSNVGIGTTNPTSKFTVKGNTSLETLSVSGVSTFSNNITFNGSQNLISYGSYLNFGTNTQQEGQIYATSEFFHINSSATEGMFIQPTGLFQIRNGLTTNKWIEANSHPNHVGEVSLYYNNSKKFETLGVGVTVTGTTFTNQLSVSDIASVGSAITMYASTGIINATTFYGNLVGSITDATNLTGGYANASQLNVSGLTTISQGRIQANAGANLRFGNIPAGSGSGRNIAIGDQVLVSLSGGQGRNIGIGELSYYDTTTGQYNIGVGERAGQKVSTGSYNVILGAYDGNSGGLDIRTSSRNVVIADGEGNIRQYINSSGNVGIKTTVVTEALTVAGIVSATSFYGTLNAGQLTGTLPAIDGSALIGVVASGTGIIIEEDGTPVGTAGTINFGSNLDVSFSGGTATVSGSGLATYANVSGIATYATTAGVSTTSGTANYATTAGVSTTSGTADYATNAGISSAVSGTININTTGIITASSFSGSGANLTNLPAGQLTGTLPALDGSALLNVTASGTGIVVDDDNVNVGSAVTVNFGTGLDVTFSAGIATITASGGSLQSRTTVSGVTASIANNALGNINITGFKSYALMKVGLSTAGWLRLYTNSASRDADVSRSIGEDPAPGSGVIAEVVTTGISTTQIISPFVMGGNLNNPADTTIYAAITNLSGSTQSITANLTILQLEA